MFELSLNMKIQKIWMTGFRDMSKNLHNAPQFFFQFVILKIYFHFFNLTSCKKKIKKQMAFLRRFLIRDYRALSEKVFFGLFLQNCSKNLLNFLHDYRGQWDASFELDGFSEKFLILVNKGLSVKNGCFWLFLQKHFKALSNFLCL